MSCDAYADVVPPFVALWRKYWPDCPFETVLLTETIGCDGFDRVLAVGRCEDWAPRIMRAIDGITTPYVLLVLNDYYLAAPVDTALVLRRLEEAKRLDALNLRLVPNPPGRKPFAGTDLLEMPKNTAYCVTCQTGIWNRGFLAGLLVAARSAWEFERHGSFMFEPSEERPLLVTAVKEFPFVDAVHKGYWTAEGVEACRLGGAAADFTARGFPPLGARVREAAKKAAFAVFPWTLIVRIQNLCDIISGKTKKRMEPRK